jgi:hypothetical protein
MKYIKKMNDHYFYGDQEESGDEQSSRNLPYLPGVIKQEMTAILKDDYSRRRGRNEGEDFAFYANLVADFIDPEKIKAVAKGISTYKTIEEVTKMFKDMLLSKFLEEKGVSDPYSYGKEKGLF